MKGGCRLAGLYLPAKQYMIQAGHVLLNLAEQQES